MYSFKVWGKGHSNELIITPETLAFVERWELFMPQRYEDGHRADGSIIYSIGFGHAEDGDNEPKKIPADMVLTIEEARALLLKDIEIKARFVRTRVKVPISTYMFGAITSLVYQYGQGRVDKAAEAGLFLPALNAGQYVKAFCQMLQLDKKKDGSVHPGLTLRRASEVGFLMHKID
jgi:GH24 family phage-related lysozyme (muramidase)